MIGPGQAVAGASGTTDKQCRRQWDDLVQLHGENGNPRGPVPALVGRWAATDRRAHALAEDATAADCGDRIDEYAAGWDALESFQYDLHAFDPRADLRRAENDRRHYLSIGNHMTPRLRRAFHVVRHQTPGAVRDLEPALDGAEDVDVRDGDAVHAFLAHARQVKRASTHVQRMRHPYRVIGNAQLDEE